MKKLLIMLTSSVFTFGCAAQGEMSKSTTQNMSHAHIGHVLKGWKDTPDNKGLLPAARSEADIAVKHAGIAVKKTADLGWMKTHTLHVIHAIAPGKVVLDKLDKGPGLGYGVLKAAKGIAKHISLAASSNDASDNVKKHAIHVNMTANNTVTRANQVLMHADKVLQATSASEAASHAHIVNSLAKHLLHGEDANGDGKISWHEGEGGLVVAEKHMGAMKKVEGI